MRKAKSRGKVARVRAGHSDSSIFIVWVLWLIGMSEPKIALVTMKGAKQVSGIVGRSPYANRSAMTDTERQKALDELIAVRMGEDGKPIDGGVLDRIPLTIIALQGRQLKRRSN